MSAPAPKKKKFTRVKERHVDMVEFTYDEVYGDEKFILPKFPPPLGILRRIQRGDVSQLMPWLIENGVDEETVEAIDDLDPAEELNDFVNAWTNGQVATAPKSSK